MNFDVEKFIDHSAKLEYDDVDFENFRSDPLDEDALRCLRYMHDIEFHTVCYLRDLLVTRAHADPEITTFLTFWVYEEFWHGEAISRVLSMHDEVAGAPRVAELRVMQGRFDRLKPITWIIASSVLRDFAAVQMSWGAINEWSTQSGYARLIAKTKHPVLAQLLKRIMKQEGRHVDFYASQATARLSTSRSARLVTRQALKFFWAPVGSGVMPESETRFITDYLFGGDDGMAVAERIDRNIDRLPGLAGLHLATGAARRYAQSN